MTFSFLLGMNFSNIVVVGNKIDKASSRKVSTESGFKLAVEMNIWFLETSAYLNMNVSSIFHCIVKKYAGCNTENKHEKRRCRISSDSEFKCQKTKTVGKSTQKLACKSAFLLLK